MKIEITKMHGAGNDFILVDNRRYALNSEQRAAFARQFCRRHLSVGADGAIFLAAAPLGWDFYNADGSNAEMCGNGARCFAIFAVSLGVANSPFFFQTRAGQIRAEISAPNRARVQLTAAAALAEKKILVPASAETSAEEFSGYYINTGVPHLVVKLADPKSLATFAVEKIGATLRYHQEFAPAGTNVDFIAFTDTEQPDYKILIRTYERGVEAETLACGTGTVAAAIVTGEIFGIHGGVRTHGGDIINVEYGKTDAHFTPIFLEGPAVKVFSGTVDFD